MRNSTFYLLTKLFILSFGILFIISPDSYTHDIFRHIDPACFFACGKAWMNGMTPYVDFADSKGPLLWLIYGIGYLISPSNYIGVFWLSVILYTAVFFYVFKIAYIFLKDERLSFYATTLMLLSFFCPWFHHETRAEDWCQIFIVLTFYYCCRWFYTENINKQKECYTTCFVLGISIAGTLLIKFTIAAMLSFVGFYILYTIIKQKINIFFSLSFFVSGMALMTVPFIVYMQYVNCFDAFIQEYFLSTVQTVQSSNTIGTYIHEWLLFTHRPPLIVLLIICISGAYMMAKIVKRNKYFFLFTFFGFYSITIHHHLYYYPCSCLIFPLFFIIPVVARQTPPVRHCTIITTLVFFFTVFINSFILGYISNELFFKNSNDRKGYYDITYIMSGIKNPTIVIYMTNEHGWGVPVNALPGCKYWVHQIGATPKMIKNQEDAIRRQKTDFVIISDFYPGVERRDQLVCESGYQPIYKYSCWDGNYTIYTKHKKLKMPSADFHVSGMDILLKRKIFK